MACPQYVNWTELNWTDLQQVDAVLVFCLRLINYVAPTAVVRRLVSHAARSNHFTEHETQNLGYPSRRRCVDIFAPPPDICPQITITDIFLLLQN